MFLHLVILRYRVCVASYILIDGSMILRYRLVSIRLGLDLDGYNDK